MSESEKGFPKNPHVEWGEFHFERKVNVVYNDGIHDYAISLKTLSHCISMRADQIHDHGINIMPTQARKLALALLRAADELERK